MSVQLYLGDCLEVMRSMPGNSIDTCITDPPYHLTSIVKRFGGENAAPAQYGTDGAFARASKGFMGKTWDGGNIAADPATWAEVYRLLKPGGLLLAFGGTRTYHRMVCAIEDAGFEIRDTIAWIYGSGFPKSYDISKGIDKQAGAEREVIGKYQHPDGSGDRNAKGLPVVNTATPRKTDGDWNYALTAPSTPEAQLWHGWGTALKPAWEIICVASKPEHTFQERGIIVESLNRLEGRLWSLLPASIAEKNFGLSRKEYEGACGSAQWSADEKQRTLEGLLGQMDMSQLESAAITSLNTVSLWKSILAEALSLLNTCTTETESSLITDLKILSYSLSQLTLQDIIKALTYQRGQPSNALTVGNLFYAVKTKLNYTQELSAQENVTSRGNQKDLRPELTPIVVAMKPVDGTYVNNALTWGVAGLWIDGGRVGTDEAAYFVTDKEPTNADGQVYGWAKYEALHKRGGGNSQGRFPANLIHDGSDEVLAAFPHSNGAAAPVAKGQKEFGGVIYGKFKTGGDDGASFYNDSGSAARFFMTCKQDDLCSLCLTPKHSIMSNIDNSEVIQCKSLFANNVEKSLTTTQATTLNIAQESVQDWLIEKAVHFAKSAGNLCEKCATSIVREVVEIKTWDSKNVVSPVIQDFIGNSNKCILIQNLAQYAEIWDSIDTTPTTTSLLTLFGYASRVITNYIQETEKTAPKRFLYSPKASRSERNAGLEGMPNKDGGHYAQDEWSRKHMGNKPDAERSPVQNHHPTVKPIELMRYLVRLTKTPTGGVVLDPFMGSGTTGCACALEGREFIGIEREQEYIEIAEKRIAYWSLQPGLEVE